MFLLSCNFTISISLSLSLSSSFFSPSESRWPPGKFYTKNKKSIRKNHCEHLHLGNGLVTRPLSFVPLHLLLRISGAIQLPRRGMSQNVLPVLLQKLVLDFFTSYSQGKFAGIRTHKIKAHKFRGKFRSIFVRKFAAQQDISDGKCHNILQNVERCRKVSYLVMVFLLPSHSRRPLVVFANAEHLVTLLTLAYSLVRISLFCPVFPAISSKFWTSQQVC